MVMTLIDQLQRLAAVEPSPYPVVSLYLNAQPDQHGRDRHRTFVRKELKARAGTYPPRSSEREMLDRDLERISTFTELPVMATRIESDSAPRAGHVPWARVRASRLPLRISGESTVQRRGASRMPSAKPA